MSLRLVKYVVVIAVLLILLTDESSANKRRSRRRRRRCLRHCRWGEWSVWSPCSATCGSHGAQIRARGISQTARCGGNPCSGPSHETMACNRRCCPRNCQWHSWSSWSSCTATCGSSGTRSRTRSKTPEYCGGTPCSGSYVQVVGCNRVCCLRNCQWGSWGACTAPCGNTGTQTRTRAIAVSASCGGSSCTGGSSQISSCNRHCPHGAPDGPSCNCADTGYSGTCCDNDIDECARGTHHCHQHANCTNTEGSYRCVCNNGYTGNGRTCTERNAPDLVSCPDDTTVTVNSPDGGLLDWTDPEFRFQPSNELADHECSANKGDAAPIGTHNVQCWAEGYADGTTCDFDVIVQAPECVVPAPPRNGAVTCGVAEGAQKYCSVSCQNSYDFAIAPADTYRCDVYGVWHPEENLQWPDCSLVYRPGRARQKNELYYYSGSCASNEEDIKRNLIQLYATLGGCSAGIRCGISDIGVTCGPSSRKRRDTPRDSELSKDNVDIVVKRSCSPGFEYWNGACYYYSPNRNTFLSAESDCDSRGATLAVVPDSATHQYLVQKARGKRFIWIGLSDRAREGTFVWSNGVSLGSFHLWRGRNNARLDCVAMVKFRRTYVWRVRECSGKNNYFCRK
ncbi:uncharacterized protein LOC144915479 [Branchiostoma floridae x Branchiostoma belcheri]